MGSCTFAGEKNGVGNRFVAKILMESYCYLEMLMKSHCYYHIRYVYDAFLDICTVNWSHVKSHSCILLDAQDLLHQSLQLAQIWNDTHPNKENLKETLHFRSTCGIP